MESDSDEEENNVCPICQRSFRTKAGAQVHWRIHSPEEVQAAINNKLRNQTSTSNASTSNVPTSNASASNASSRRDSASDFRCFECGFDGVDEGGFIAHMRQHLGNSDSAEHDTGVDLSASNQDFIAYISNLKQTSRLVKRIPKGARSVVANDFSILIEKCIASNSVQDWRNLLLFAHRTFRLPDKKDGLSLVQIIKQNASTPLLPPQSHKLSNKQASLSNRIEVKLADFDIRGAVKLMSSTDSLACNNNETFEELLKKHPEPSRPLSFPSDPDESIQPLQVDSDVVQSSICSFANGSNAGTDGLRPQHLKDIISLSAGEAGQRALKSITKLCNFLLAGKLNDDMCELLYGASLCALVKKDGGIRPIAIGSTIRRLTSKIGCFSVKNDMVNYLLPRQIGFGVKFGCEGAIHAVRSYVHNNRSTSKVIVKVDVKNAFNSAERDVMLIEIKAKVPQLYHYLRQCYLQPSYLLFGDKIIWSKVGAQQGDPAGPLIFSLAIHPLISQLTSELNIWYLDDGTIGDSPDIVLSNLAIIIEKARSLGLDLNSEKCELYFCNGQVDFTVVNDFEHLAPGIRIVTNDDLELLGAPLLQEGMESFTRIKFEKILVLINRLNSLQTHYAYFILKNCFAIPKLVHLFRCTPLWMFPDLLHDMDMKIKSAMEIILNTSLNTIQWIQSSLPVNFGGLGIRSLLDLSLPAYLSSVSGVKDIVSNLINIQDYESEIPYFREASNEWMLVNHGELPDNTKSQFFWDQINTKRIASELIFPNEVEQFRFLLLQNKMSGAWLNVVPSPNIGTFLNNDVMRTCVGLRLGTKICHPFVCACGVSVDSLGRHGLHCKKNPGKYFRHADLNQIVHQSLASINMGSLLEPTGLFRDDGKKRPDGITYTAWEKGRALVWDATCADSLAKSNLTGRKHPGMASERAVIRKHSKYSKLKQNYIFVALAVESLGPWSKEAVDLLDKIGSNLIRTTGEPKAKHYLFQRISLAIQRGNALSIISSIPKGPPLDEVYHLQ